MSDNRHNKRFMVEGMEINGKMIVGFDQAAIEEELKQMKKSKSSV